MQPATQERPLGELFKELAGETGTLVRQEVQLAATELTAKATRAGTQVALVGAGQRWRTPASSCCWPRWFWGWGP